MADDKTRQIINNYINYAQKYILDHKKQFSSWNTIYNKFIKKNKVDPAFEYTKEIIKRLERDKVSSQSAMQMVETIMPEVKGMKKEVIVMVLPMILGAILLITFSLLFSFTRPFNLSNHFVIYYAVGMFISGLVFGFGMFQRKKVKMVTLTRAMFFQALTAYGAAKMQGQGSFAAFRILEEMRANPGKELQIKITQPKIMYK